MCHRMEENVDLGSTHCASVDTAIPPTNVGYQLLQRMGWRGGGLGREQQGAPLDGLAAERCCADLQCCWACAVYPSCPASAATATSSHRLSLCCRKPQAATSSHKPSQAPIPCCCCLPPPLDTAGICEPVRLDANDTGVRIGLGRGEVEQRYTAAENVERRALEVEIQADEDEDRKQRREVRWGGVRG